MTCSDDISCCASCVKDRIGEAGITVPEALGVSVMTWVAALLASRMEALRTGLSYRGSWSFSDDLGCCASCVEDGGVEDGIVLQRLLDF